MAAITEPTRTDIEGLVARFLDKQPRGLGFAVGYASPDLPNNGDIQFFGNIQNQFGGSLCLDRNTPFEIASITKTFTATLYAHLIRRSDANKTIGDFLCPNGPFTNSKLAKIKLDQLVNYTSGLPQDNENAGPAAPQLWPQPYSMQGMISFLNVEPPQVPLALPGKRFTYSNLAFAIMSAIIASDRSKSIPAVHAFTKSMQAHIFDPLRLDAKFFNETSLAKLPLGFEYNSWPSRNYSPPGYWPKAPGHPLYPAYFGEAGIVATPEDMFKWLKFNMGLEGNAELRCLLRALHCKSTDVTTSDPDNSDAHGLGLGWFIDPKDGDWPGCIFKDGRSDGFTSYMAFVPSPNPGKDRSPAGAFVLMNAAGITHDQKPDGENIAVALTNDLLRIMLGLNVPSDKSAYPCAALKRS